ncbi:hypothetical protein [Vibrio phage VP16T]|nr:hypothetical protein [Vibrio phage VP16T]
MDVDDVQGTLAPGYRIRNKRGKRRVFKKTTRQRLRAENRKEIIDAGY